MRVTRTIGYGEEASRIFHFSIFNLHFAMLFDFMIPAPDEVARNRLVEIPNFTIDIYSSQTNSRLSVNTQ